MAAGAGTVTIKILGDAKGAMKAFAETEAGSESLGGKLKNLGTGMLAVGAVVAGAAAGIGVALYDIGSQFDDAYDKIRTGTGATGTDLEVLKDEFRKVVSDVPTDFGKASDAVEIVQQKLSIAGTAAAGISEQFLELSRISKTDLATNLQAGTDALNNWGTVTKDQPALLDEMFRATQLTGISFSDLATQMSDSGLVLRGLGLTFDQSVGLLSALKTAGLDAGDVMPSLTRALSTAAKEGKNAGQLLQETIDGVKNGSAGAEEAAVKLFGAKGAGKFIELIKEGKLDYDGLLSTIQSGSDTIIGAGKETQDFAEKWELFKNRVLLALEPIAARVFDGMGKAMDKIGPIATEIATAFSEQGLGGALRKIGQHFANLSPTIKVAIVALGAVGIALWAAFAPVSLIAVGIAALVGGLIYAYTNFEGFRNVVDSVSKWLVEVAWPAFVQVFTGIVTAIQATISFVQDNWHYVQTAFETVATALQVAWDTIGYPVFNAIVGVVTDIVGFFQASWPTVEAVFQTTWEIVSGAWTELGEPIFHAIQDVVSTLIDWWSTAWDPISAVFSAAWSAAQSAWDAVGAPIFAAIMSVIQGVLDGIQHIKDAWNSVKDIPGNVAGALGVGNTGWADKYLPPGHNAMGTNYWRGGLSWVGERGPELVNLPRGSQVIPNGRAMAMGGGDTHFHVHIGTVIGSDLRRAAEEIRRELLKKSARNPAGVIGLF